MAKKSDQAGGHREIIRDIRNGNAAPVYLLHGEEPYYLDLITENLEHYIVDEGDRDFNLDIYYGNDADVDYIVASAKQFPVMASRRLVILKEAQAMTKAKTELEKFAKYAQKPTSSTVFAIVYKGEPLGTTHELVKAVKKGGGVNYVSPEVKDYQLIPAAMDYCMEKRISIEEKAIQLLVEFVGSPLSKLFGELDKLHMVKGKERITCDDVEKNIGVSKDFNNFELVNALSVKDYPKAMRIVKYFENNPKSTGKNSHVVTTAGILFNYFSTLVAAHYITDKSDEGLIEGLGLKGKWQLPSYRAGLRNYTAAKAVNVVHYLRDFDVRSKGVGSNQSDTQLLGELVFKIFT